MLMYVFQPTSTHLPKLGHSSIARVWWNENWASEGNKNWGAMTWQSHEAAIMTHLAKIVIFKEPSSVYNFFMRRNKRMLLKLHQKSCEMMMIRFKNSIYFQEKGKSFTAKDVAGWHHTFINDTITEEIAVVNSNVIHDQAYVVQSLPCQKEGLYKSMHIFIIIVYLEYLEQ